MSLLDFSPRIPLGTFSILLITIADKRMNNLMKGIKTNSMAISTMSEMVNKKFLNIEQAYMNMSRIIVQQVSEASTLRNTFNKLESSVQTLVENRLTPYLIPKSSLIKTIQHIHRLLRKNYKQFYLTHTDPAFYYSHAKFVYARVKSSLYITVKFPVSTYNKPLELYKVIHSKKCNLRLPYEKHVLNVRCITYIKRMDRAPYI